MQLGHWNPSSILVIWPASSLAGLPSSSCLEFPGWADLGRWSASTLAASSFWSCSALTMKSSCRMLSKVHRARTWNVSKITNYTFLVQRDKPLLRHVHLLHQQHHYRRCREQCPGWQARYLGGSDNTPPLPWRAQEASLARPGRVLPR